MSSTIQADPITFQGEWLQISRRWPDSFNWNWFQRLSLISIILDCYLSIIFRFYLTSKASGYSFVHDDGWVRMLHKQISKFTEWQLSFYHFKCISITTKIWWLRLLLRKHLSLHSLLSVYKYKNASRTDRHHWSEITSFSRIRTLFFFLEKRRHLSWYIIIIIIDDILWLFSLIGNQYQEKSNANIFLPTISEQRNM